MSYKSFVLHSSIDDEDPHYQSTDGPSGMEPPAKRPRPSEDLRHALGIIMIIHSNRKIISIHISCSSNISIWSLLSSCSHFRFFFISGHENKFCIDWFCLPETLFGYYHEILSSNHVYMLLLWSRSNMCPITHWYHLSPPSTDRRQAVKNPDENSPPARKMGNATASASRFGHRNPGDMVPSSPLNFSQNEEMVTQAACDKGITENQQKNLFLFFKRHASHRAKLAFYEDRFSPIDLQVNPQVFNNRGGRGRGRGRGGNQGRGGRGGQVKALMD